MGEAKLVAFPTTVSIPQDVAVAFFPGGVVHFSYDVVDTPLMLIVDVVQIKWTEIGSEVSQLREQSNWASRD